MNELLANLAAKAGAAVPQVTSLALRGLQFEGIFALCITGFFMVCSFVVLWALIKYTRKMEPFTLFLGVWLLLSVFPIGASIDDGVFNSNTWMKAFTPDVYVVNQARHRILDKPGESGG